MAKEENDKFEELMELAHRKHPTFKGLYDDHKTAMKKAQEAAKDEPEDINLDTVTEHFARFIHTYDSISKYRIQEPTKWDDLPDHHKAQFRGMANHTLEQLARNKETSVPEIIDDIEAGRLSWQELYLTHAKSSQNESVALYLRDRVGKMVDKYDDDNAKFWIGKLKGEDRTLKEKDDALIRENLTDYVLGHAMKYHQKTKPEKKKAA